jgi:hypothetical protein
VWEKRRTRREEGEEDQRESGRRWTQREEDKEGRPVGGNGVKEGPSLTVPQVSEIESQILLPLQNLLETLANQKYLNAILSVVKVILFLNVPEISTKCLAILLRTPWPCKPVAETMFRLVRWNLVGNERNLKNVIAVFKELYGLFEVPSVKAYFELSLAERFPHISKFVGGLGQSYVIAQQVYKIDPRVAQVNDNDVCYPGIFDLKKVRIFFWLKFFGLFLGLRSFFGVFGFFGFFLQNFLDFDFLNICPGA